MDNFIPGYLSLTSTQRHFVSEQKGKLLLSDLFLCKILLARKMPLCGHQGLIVSIGVYSKYHLLVSTQK